MDRLVTGSMGKILGQAIFGSEQAVFEQVEKNIDDLVANSVDWSACASKEQLQAAREGKLGLRFFDRDVPEEWLKDVRGKRVLCLAGAGGLQAPLLACAGAEVTVIDIPDKMLDKDREIAERENLRIEIVKGNMCDLYCLTISLAVKPDCITLTGSFA